MLTVGAVGTSPQSRASSIQQMGTCVLTKSREVADTEAAMFSFSAEGTQNKDGSNPSHHQGKMMRLLRT